MHTTQTKVHTSLHCLQTCSVMRDVLCPTCLHIRCRIVNWVTTANGRVHTADTTQLDSTRQDKFSTCSVSKFSLAVVSRRRELVANSIHTADADARSTQLNSTVESRRRRRCVLSITFTDTARRVAEIVWQFSTNIIRCDRIRSPPE